MYTYNTVEFYLLLKSFTFIAAFALITPMSEKEKQEHEHPCKLCTTIP